MKGMLELQFETLRLVKLFQLFCDLSIDLPYVSVVDEPTPSLFLLRLVQ